jgi:SAM-dependent methyltransferase
MAWPLLPRTCKPQACSPAKSKTVETSEEEIMATIYNTLPQTDLPRLPDGTLSFIGRAAVDDSSWDSVYESRQDSSQDVLADSNFSADDEEFFETKSGSTFFQLLSTLLNQVPEGSATLEVGCGFAGISLAIARRWGHDVYGIDTSSQAIQSARGRFGEFGLEPDRLSVCDVNRLPFPDNTFTLIFGKTVFEHFEDPQQAAKEIFRTAAPGCKVVLDVPNLRNSYWTRASERVLKHNHKTDYFTIERFSGYLEAAGFRIRETWGEALFYTTPFIVMNEFKRLLSRGDQSVGSSKSVSETKSRVASNSGLLFGALTSVDAVTKRFLRAMNLAVSKTPLVTPKTGVIIGLVGEKP